MATELLILPEKHHLVPATPYDAELVDGLRDRTHYKAKLTLATVRSVKQNRYYWGGVLETAIDNHPFYLSSKPLHIWLKTRLGLVEKMTFHDNTAHFEVDSTSFGSMPSDEFKSFLDNAILLICTEVIPGLDPAMLKSDAERRTGVSYREATMGAAA
jgi:hypothetical protein